MSELIIANLSKIIAIIAIFEFEFVLIYRRRYLKKDNRTNFIVMIASIVVFMDAFIYTVFAFSNVTLFASPVAGMARFIFHCAAVIFFMGFYIVKTKAE